jgi:poly(3-hydroxybutyrate) depolymerase
MTAAMLAAYPERFAGGAIVAGVPYRCAETVAEALHCMNPGVDLAPAEWRRRVLERARPEGRRIPPVSIWQWTADTLVVPRNQQELVEQWTAVHGISSTPARSERKGSIMRELFSDTAGDVRVESVLVDGLAHAFPPYTQTGHHPAASPEILWSQLMSVVHRDHAVLGAIRRQLAQEQNEKISQPIRAHAFFLPASKRILINGKTSRRGRRGALPETRPA